MRESVLSNGGSMFLDAFQGRRVLVTGHTGFKGSWLCAWLLDLGAEVGGYSLGVPTTPAAFEALGLEERIQHHLGDIRDRNRFQQVVNRFQPDVVIHLAAQSLVRRSYAEPLYTFEVNALGTANVLETIRTGVGVRAAVIVTSDKCYRNVAWVWGYREDDRLGGEDPYSGSKAAAEMVFHSFAQSYFAGGRGPRIASARAGNVIGGGDWAADRILPDCVRAWSCGESVVLRNPDATRPWQHVLEPLSGYLWLAANLMGEDGRAAGESYNFGPVQSVGEPVSLLVEEMSKKWGAARWSVDLGGSDARPEAALLKLSCDRALAELQWRPTLDFEETIGFTSDWYRCYYEAPETDFFELTRAQIAEYCRRARDRGVRWALS